jgi:hypothetical protein
MVGVLIAEHWLPLSHRGHNLLEFCLFLIWTLLVARWCRRNRAALDAVAEQQDRAHRTSEPPAAEGELTPVQAHYRHVMAQHTAKNEASSRHELPRSENTG